MITGRESGMDLEMGCRLAVDDWVWLNRVGAFQEPGLRAYVSPFPPPALMQNVSGLVGEEDFASRGADFYLALSQASSAPLSAYKSLLDFGCGCGRLARLFKGHPGSVHGRDIDRRHVEWVARNLSFMESKLSSVRPPTPYEDGQFDAIISISIFTHLNEASQDRFLAELARLSSPQAHLFLTVHGQKALSRAVNEPTIRGMLAMDESAFRRARDEFADGKHAFILQQGHLTTTVDAASTGARRIVNDPFEYGITFMPEGYVRDHWGRWFDIVDYRHGALHSFQDTVVLRPKKGGVR